MVGQLLCRLGFHSDRIVYTFRDSRRVIVECRNCSRWART